MLHHTQQHKTYTRQIIAALLLLFCTQAAMAQDTGTPQAVTGKTNWLEILLLVAASVLAFVIWGMGQTLITISKQVLKKRQQAKKMTGLVLLLGLLGTAAPAFAQEAATPVTKVIPNYGGMSPTAFWVLAITIMAEVIIILALWFHIKRLYAELLPEELKAVQPAKTSPLSEWWHRFDKRFLTRATPIEKEADVLLDHNYDGIRELDNALPPWWKYGFYLTIASAVIYLFYFHGMGDGKNPEQEYAAEMADAKEELAAFNAQNKDKIDENNIPMADAAGISSGKTYYLSACAACHGKLGEGGAGPNLTDDFWLHGGSINAIYNTIKIGYPDKGMQSWKGQFTPKEMSYISSYIKTLRGTNPPNPKAPQGDPYTESAPNTNTDSLNNGKKDSLKAAKPIAKATN
jgi:cytochrome c oxidase cbb3-type subunit III